MNGALFDNTIKSIKDIYKQTIKGLFGGGSSNKNQNVRVILPKRRVIF